MNKEKIIPIFYASDLNYLPYLSVSLLSLKSNANKKQNYKIYILNSGIDELKQTPILALKENWFDIEFINIKNKLDEVNSDLQLRDYYTVSTYYRMFIADMFIEYDKAIYLDSDTIILDDISKLFSYKLGDNFVGAITDQVVSNNEIFKRYTSEVLGINSKYYFNAGVLLMNLKKFRENKFYKLFTDLLKKYKFVVAQDQDYLNVICKDKVKFISYSWNTMPVDDKNAMPNLIHYNLTLKPWHYKDIPYSKHFWNYAKNSYYYKDIEQELNNYTLEKIEKDKTQEANLINLAIKEINNKNNYLKQIEDRYHIFDFLFDEEENIELEENINAI